MRSLRAFCGYVALVATMSEAFLPSTTPFGIPRSSTHLSAGKGGMAQPSVEIGQKTAIQTKVGQKTTSVTHQRTRVDEPKTRKERKVEDAPLYKVMLIADDDYDQAHTIQRLTEVMEDIDEGLASTIFKSAMVEGKAMCGKYPLEHAEMYVEQLLRSDPIIFSELQEENDNKQ